MKEQNIPYPCIKEGDSWMTKEWKLNAKITQFPVIQNTASNFFYCLSFTLCPTYLMEIKQGTAKGKIQCPLKAQLFFKRVPI